MLPPTTRRPPDTTAVLIMVVLCFCWGFQQVAIKLIATDVAPLMQIIIRSALPTLVLGGWIIWRNGLAPFRDGTLPIGIGVGVLFALEFLFVAQAINYTLASHVSVFLYTAPIFAALALHFRIPEERLSALQWLGVLIAFGGIALSFIGGGSNGAASNMALGDLFALLGGAAWGATTVAVRTSRLSDAPAAKTLFYQVATAVVVLSVVALITGQTHVQFTQAAIISLSFQSIIVTLGTFLVWFWLLRRYLASRLSILSFLTPILGVAISMLVLHETVTLAFGIGAAMVLAGVTLVSAAELTGRKKPATA